MWILKVSWSWEWDNDFLSPSLVKVNGMHWLKQEILWNNSVGDCDIEGFHDMQTQWLEFRLHKLFGMWTLCCNAFAFPVTLELCLPLQVLLNNGNRSAGCRSWCRGTANTILNLRVALQTGSHVFPTTEHPVMAGAFRLHFWSTFFCVCLWPPRLACELNQCRVSRDERRLTPEMHFWSHWNVCGHLL